MSYLTDRKRAEGHGSASSGTKHFIAQRLSALTLIPLLVLFLIFVAPLIGHPIEDVRAAFGNFWVSLIAAATIIVVAMHLAEGLQVVAEDYIGHKGARIFALLKIKAGIPMIALAALWALVKMGMAG